MSENNNDRINIDEIILDVKKEIQAKFTPEEILEFEPVSSDAAVLRLSLDSIYDPAYCEDKLIDCMSDKHIEWYRDFPGDTMSVFLKKIVRRLSACVIAPICEDTNKFNNDVVEVLLQVSARMDEQDRLIRDLKARIEQLETRDGQLQ